MGYIMPVEREFGRPDYCGLGPQLACTVQKVNQGAYPVLSLLSNSLPNKQRFNF